MSFLRHKTESIDIKKEAEKSTSVIAIGLSYPLLGCSPAEPSSVLLNASKITKSNSTVYFTLPLLFR